MTRPDETLRRVEGSGPWLHQPRKPEPRFNVVFWLAICAGITLAAAMLIAISAMAAEIPEFVPAAGFEMCRGSC